MQSFGLLPTITVPTRITTHSATLLDNFFISNSFLNYETWAIYDDVSDHLPILLKVNYKKSQNKAITDINTKNYIFSKANCEKFQSAINSETWPNLSSPGINNLSSSEAYNSFHQTFTNYFNDCFLNNSSK